MTVAPLQSKNVRLRSSIESIGEVEGLINTIFEDYDLSPDYYGNMLVALTEAVNNAVVHGNKLNPGIDVDLSFHHKGDEFQFIIKDSGTGFDYKNIPDPTSPENIDKPDGRGIFLMKNLADRVNFLDDGRQVELIFKAF